MLPKWNFRPEVTAHLLNPAFSTRVLGACIRAHNGESNTKMPFELTFIILPFILSSRIRERLPSRKGWPIHKWASENEDIKIGLPRLIKGYVPFTREAIFFGMVHNTLFISTEGLLDASKIQKEVDSENEEIADCLRKSAALGRNLARSGTPSTIYSILGIRP